MVNIRRLKHIRQTLSKIMESIQSNVSIFSSMQMVVCAMSLCEMYRNGKNMENFQYHKENIIHSLDGIQNLTVVQKSVQILLWVTGMLHYMHTGKQIRLRIQSSTMWWMEIKSSIYLIQQTIHADMKKNIN